MNEPRVCDKYGVVHVVYWRASDSKTWTWCEVRYTTTDLRDHKGVLTCLMCAAR